MDDSISRRAMQEIVDRIGGMYPYRQIGNRESYSSYNEAWTDCINRVDAELNSLPSAEPEPLSDAYTKAVWTWLLNYQIKAAELKGRYTPYEVLSWVANDWRKEHEGSD